MLSLWQSILNTSERGENTVLAVILESSGSTPRKAGAFMLCGAGGRLEGTIGGGISEHLACEEAKILLREKLPYAIKEYLLYPNDNADIGGQCGGQVKVLFVLLDAGEETISFARDAAAAFTSSCAALKFEFNDTGEAVTIKILRGHYKNLPAFTFPLFPAGFVYIAGGGHIAMELCPLLTRLRFRVIVIEERAEFALKERFRGAQEVMNQNYSSLENLLGEEDYAVIITSGHNGDFEAARAALKTKAAYIGIIGSAKKQAFVRTRLMNAGFSAAQIDAPRVHAPIGIKIGGETPEEVALSIAAELVKVRSERKREICAKSARIPA